MSWIANNKSFNNRKLRKQILKIKGKMYILADYISPSGRVVTIISNSQYFVFEREIDKKRAVVNATSKGLLLANRLYQFPTGSKLLRIIDWGVLYGNDEVIIKRYSVNGKYRTGVWLKGQRGLVYSEVYKYDNKNKIKNIIDEEELSSEGDINKRIWRA